MRMQIRKDVFESNSSSVHSLSISKSGRRPGELPMNSDGKVIAYLGQFGKELRYYDTQIEKLSYLMTCCKYLSRGFDIESIYETYEFKEIEEAVMDYIPNCNGIEIHGSYDDGEIDHQSQPEGYFGGMEIINVYDKDAIIDFIFNEYVSLKTDCD